MQHSVDVPHGPRRELRPPLPNFRLEASNEVPDVARSDIGEEEVSELGQRVTLQTRLIVAGAGNIPKAPVLDPAGQIALDGKRAERGFSEAGCGLNAPFDGLQNLGSLGLLPDGELRRRIFPRAVGGLVPNPELVPARVNGSHAHLPRVLPRIATACSSMSISLPSPSVPGERKSSNSVRRMRTTCPCPYRFSPLVIQSRTVASLTRLSSPASLTERNSVSAFCAARSCSIAERSSSRRTRFNSSRTTARTLSSRLTRAPVRAAESVAATLSWAECFVVDSWALSPNHRPGRVEPFHQGLHLFD